MIDHWDPEVVKADRSFKDVRHKLFNRYGMHIEEMMRDRSFVEAGEHLQTLQSTRYQYHRRRRIEERLTVLESIFRLVHDRPGFSKLRTDLRRYLSEAQIMIDIADKPPMILPMEDALLQMEVINRLLPRLAVRFPQQEKDLVKAYHDLVQGGDTDTVFVHVVKALEEIARGVSGVPNLTLDDHNKLKAAFPNLHPTIQTTIIKLTAHRGDRAAHGRQGPAPHEMRYLLFAVCNVALLFLDYPKSTPADLQSARHVERDN